MRKRLIMEGGSRGANSKYLQIKARKAVHRFLERCGYAGRQPAVDLMGGRRAVYETFVIRHANARVGEYVALWVDSEDPVADMEKPWDHLEQRKDDGWNRPAGATDEQALLMVTCMETWIACDRDALSSHYGSKLKANKLPPLVTMESRQRHDVQDAIYEATDGCKNVYAKGEHSFGAVAELSPGELEKHLPSFKRFKRILDKTL